MRGGQGPWRGSQNEDGRGSPATEGESSVHRVYHPTVGSSYSRRPRRRRRGERPLVVGITAILFIVVGCMQLALGFLAAGFGLCAIVNIIVGVYLVAAGYFTWNMSRQAFMYGLIGSVLGLVLTTVMLFIFVLGFTLVEAYSDISVPAWLGALVALPVFIYILLMLLLVVSRSFFED